MQWTIIYGIMAFALAVENGNSPMLLQFINTALPIFITVMIVVM
jgi:hypothetical protein